MTILTDYLPPTRVLGAISSVVCSRIIFSLHALAEEEAQDRCPTSRGGGTTGVETRFAVPMRDLNTFGTIGTTGLGQETGQAGQANQASPRHSEARV
ncbi:hypothetical protein FS749_013713 [Ceratobasidium sp. UAMH 11750]|nr:hypothetical protein FS749_013713 [Ceratobasidium sp. UAMH 11750]